MANKKKTGTEKKTQGVKKTKSMKKPVAKQPRSVKNAAGKPGSAPASSTRAAAEGDTCNIILSYKSLAEPAPAEMASAKQLISTQREAKILRERPGMLKVSVPSAEKQRAHEDLKKLRKWNISEEGVARIKKR